MSRPFEAQYPGTCSACDERFEARTLILVSSSGARHDVCPEPTPMVAREVCPRCFLEQSVSGACGCEDTD